jgi:Acetyltransferase (GNAT) family.
MNDEEQLEEFKLSITLRRATALDMPEVASVFGKSRRQALPFLPVLHTPEEDIAYFLNSVFPNNQVYVAVDKKIVGFIAFDQEWVHHLYLLPDHQNMGTGARLLELAKKDATRLQLWAFQKNTRALEFYARHGFRVLKETDGAENQEKEPDALLEWS